MEFRPQKIKITIGGIPVVAELKPNRTAQAIIDALPIEAPVNQWGEEFYCNVPGVKDHRETARLMPAAKSAISNPPTRIRLRIKANLLSREEIDRAVRIAAITVSLFSTGMATYIIFISSVVLYRVFVPILPLNASGLRPPGCSSWRVAQALVQRRPGTQAI